jgi:6-phosphogluconolactonase (cycloisomerase 2 family)
VVSIAITPATATVASGGTQQFVAMGTFTDASQQDLTTDITWGTADSTIATVNATGLVTAQDAPLGVTRSTTVTALYTAPAGGAAITIAPAALTVTPATLVSIAVSVPQPSLAVGTSEQLTAIGTYSDGTSYNITANAQISWASATPSQVSVGNTAGTQGFVTAVAATTTPVAITATVGTIVSAPATITVTSAMLVSVAIAPTAPTIAPAATQQFKATGTFSDGTTQDITGEVAWTSATPATATISNAAGSQGIATAAAVGTTSIGASASPPLAAVTATPVTLTVATTLYAYASNFDAASVSEYVIGAGGVVTLEPTGQYVYVANYGSANVSEYSIGPGGILAPVGAGAVATGTGPNGVTLDHANPNRFAYVANYGDSTVSQYSIGPDGALQALGTPIATGPYPSSIVLDATSSFAYVANFGGPNSVAPPGPETISQYLVNPNGTLTPMTKATVPTGGGPAAIIVDPAGKYVYTANSIDNTVSQYYIGNGGGLTPIAPATQTGGRPFGLAIDPKSKFLFVANSSDGTISVFPIGAGGALGTILPPVAAGAGVSSVTVDATSTYLYATNRGTTTISQFTIGAGGGLTPLVPPTAPASNHPTSIATGY